MKKTKRPVMRIIPGIMTIVIAAILAGCSMNSKYPGYRVIEKKFVPEVNAECVYLEHIKSGAHVFKIKADDPNKLFAIAFKTIPNSDFGTPHIIEHTVLNGSTNFPVKSPFDVLMQGSLNTFLNAMTGADMTIYPVASMNDKDYFNLMHVYLDAVFNPLIYKDQRIFEQEGWHYELTAEDQPLTYKGVVYNEMKGAYSSPDEILDSQVSKALYPDSPYHYSSGGDPAEIPGLTYEGFLDFHSTYYHPSNSYILLYGDADLGEELSFIDENYLSKYDKSDKTIEIPEQKPFTAMKRVVAGYPALEGADTKDQTYLELAIMTGHSTDYAKNMALDIFSDIFVNQESAPLRLALQNAGIGSDVSAYLDDNKQNALHIIVRNANEEDLDRFYDVTMKTLQQQVDTGFDKSAIEGTLNRMEFRLREGNSPQKGLTYGMQMLHGWFFSQDPFVGLEYEKPLAEVKKSLDGPYLEDIVRSSIIGNPTAVLIALKPVPGMQSKIDKEVADKLAEKKASLSPEEIQNLIKETNELIEYQKSEDTPEALATIPLLSLTDINKNALWYEASEKMVNNTKVIHFDDFTSHILYSKMLFDLRVLNSDQLQYASLLSNLMGKFNTENYSYGELDNELNINTGGFSTGTTSYLKDLNTNNLIPKFVITEKGVTSKTDKMFDLASEVILHSKYDDKERMKVLLTRHLARVESNVKNNGMGVAVSRLNSYFSKSGVYNEKMNGLDYYWFLSDLVNNFDAKYNEIVKNLEEVSNLLFTQSDFIAAVTCSGEDFETYSTGLTKFTEALPEGTADYKDWDLTPVKKNEGFMSTSKVQYVMKGANMKDLGYDYTGKTMVLNQVISTDWLQNQVRVIGGAYGGFAGFSDNGNTFFGSYRDPNLAETIANYDKTPDYLKDFSADEKTMTRYIIGTIAGIDRPETPSIRGNNALSRYFEGITRDIVQKERDDILSTTSEDISGMSEMVKAILDQNNLCVYGNADKIKSNKNLFMTIMNPIK